MIDISANAQLMENREYFLGFETNENILSWIAKNPNWTQRILSEFKKRASGHLIIHGGGVAYVNLGGGTQRRVFMLRVEVSRDDPATTSAATMRTMQLVTWPLAVVVAAIAAVLAVGGLVYRKQLEPGDDKTMAGKVQSVAELNRSKAWPIAATAALALGAWLLIREL